MGKMRAEGAWSVDSGSTAVLNEMEFLSRSKPEFMRFAWRYCHELLNLTECENGCSIDGAVIPFEPYRERSP